MEHTPTAETVIDILNLEPLPEEGGWYRETYRSDGVIPVECLPGRFDGARAFGTAIYYLLTSDDFSAFHRLPGDELFHYYLGSPAELYLLDSAGDLDVKVLGQDLAAGHQPQCVVPGETWQALRSAGGAGWTLLGTTMAPGFDFGDFTLGGRDELLRRFPQHEAVVRELTRG